jgi:hypothetical protein
VITIAMNRMPTRKSCIAVSFAPHARLQWVVIEPALPLSAVSSFWLSSIPARLNERHARTPICAPKNASRREKTARQQGGLFFRENSSNGGKAIRTFWLHTKIGPNRCQGQNFAIATI